MPDGKSKHDPVVASPFGDTPALEGLSLRVDRHAGRPRVPYHYHDLCELVLLRGGGGSRVVGDSFEAVSGRDLILVGPALPHGWSVAPEAPREEAGMEFVVALFTRESLGMELLAKPEFRLVRALIDRAGRGLAWTPEAAAEVEERFFALPDHPPAGRLLRFLDVLTALAESPASELVSPDYRPHDVQREHAALAKVLERVQQRDGEGISLAEAARCVHMSVPSFTRFFRRMTGRSFVEHLNEWRIRRACILLRETDERILDVAVACGFQNLSHFNRQFRRRRGTTPSIYRREPRAAADG